MIVPTRKAKTLSCLERPIIAENPIPKNKALVKK